MRVQYPKLYNMTHLLAFNVLLLPNFYLRSMKTIVLAISLHLNEQAFMSDIQYNYCQCVLSSDLSCEKYAGRYFLMHSVCLNVVS